MSRVKGFSRCLLTGLAMVGIIGVLSFGKTVDVCTVYAANSIEDNVGGSSSVTQDSSQPPVGDFFNEVASQDVDENDKAFSNWISGQGGMTSDQMTTASNTASPITNLIGWVTGIIVVLLLSMITMITMLDLLYIAVPPVRNFLYKPAQAGAGMGVGMSGGIGGFGRGMMGSQGTGTSGTHNIQWISDEAVACVALLGASSQSQPVGMGMQPQQNQSVKSVLFLYFKKKLFFLLLLAICLIVLSSSMLMDCGVNLAQWVLKIIGLLNGKLS